MGGGKYTFVTANWKVRSEMICAVLFEIMDSIEIQLSAPDGLETWNTVLTEEFVTVKSCDWLGNEEEKVHSSSMEARCEVPLLCRSPRREGCDCDCVCAGGDLTDCWNWKGLVVRDVDDNAANGSVLCCADC